MYTIDQAEKEINFYKQWQSGCERNDEELNNTTKIALDMFKSISKYDKTLNTDGFKFDANNCIEIFNRLVRTAPLTIIENTEDVWKLVAEDFENISKQYQCTRLTSLFKDVYKDGTCKYFDVRRFSFIEVSNPSKFVTIHSGFVSYYFNKLFPIKFPYVEETYEVYGDDYLTNRKNGDFDTIAIYYYIDPCGNKVDMHKYFKCDDYKGDEDFVEISKFKFIIRKIKHNLRKIKEAYESFLAETNKSL